MPAQTKVTHLERLDQAQGLINVPANGQVVDGHLAQDALGRDDEEAPDSTPAY